MQIIPFPQKPKSPTGEGTSEGQVPPLSFPILPRGPTHPKCLTEIFSPFPCSNTNVQSPPGLGREGGCPPANTFCVSQSLHEGEARSLERDFSLPSELHL